MQRCAKRQGLNRNSHLPVTTDRGEFKVYLSSLGKAVDSSVRIKQLPKCTTSGAIFHDASLVRGPNRESCVIINVHADSGDGKEASNISQIKALKEHYQQEMRGYPIIIGGDSNLYYGGQDKQGKEYGYQSQLDLAKALDMHVIISTKAVKKVRPNNFFRNAQNAYKTECLIQESMCICMPKSVDVEELSEKYPDYHILSLEGELQSIFREFHGGKRYQVVEAFTDETPSDHVAIYVEYGGMNFVFSNNANIRDHERGLVRSVFVEGQDPDDQESKRFGGQLCEILEGLYDKFCEEGLYEQKYDLAGDRVDRLKQLSDSKMKQGFISLLTEVLGERNEEGKDILDCYLDKLYALAFGEDFRIIQRMQAYAEGIARAEDKEAFKVSYKKRFCESIKEGMIRGITRKGTLEYATNPFFSKLQSTAVAGFEAARLYEDSAQWQRAQIKKYQSLGNPRLPTVLFCSEDKDPKDLG